jgi:hypothetical protein
MYVNGKMRDAETISGMVAGGKRRMMEGVISTTIYCKNFCKFHNVTLITTIIKKEKYAFLSCLS